MIPLPWWLNVALLLGGAGIGWLGGRALARRGATVQTATRRAPWLYVAPVLLGTLLLAHFVLNGRADLWWLLPPWLEARYFLVLWTALLLVCASLFALVAAVAFAEAHPQRRQLVVAALLVLTALEVPLVGGQRPIWPLLREQLSEGVVLQTSGVSCVAASSANLLRLAGHEATERELARRLYTSSAFGTTAGRALEVLRDAGLPCVKVEQPDPDRLALPAMLMVDHAAAGQESHAVVLAHAADHYEIWDPLDGKRLLTRDELRAIWHGRALACGASAP